MNNIKTTSIEIGGKTLSFETGKLALQAQGSILCRYGDIALLTTTGVGTPRDGIDFFPMVVDFEAKYYASGKIKGSRFMKREGRATDNAILIARMVDRPLRPMFPKGMINEVQIICSLLQGDSEHSAAALAITSASLSILMAGLPFEAPVSAVRVGIDESGNFFLDPSFTESETGELDLLVAGTAESVMMVEAGANLLSNEKMLQALEFAHAEIKKICQAQLDFLAQLEITPIEPLFKPVSAEAETAVNSYITEAELDAISGTKKQEVKAKLHEVQEKLFEKYASELEAETFTKKDLISFLDKAFAKSLRRRVFNDGVRLDNRKPEEVRPIYTEVGLFPRVHGSALFQRGETQALTMTTLGGPRDEQLLDEPDQPEYTKRYMHHYNFPPYSVGETRPMRGPGRREIGHGALAERALRYVMPTADEGYDYTTRVVSEIMTCNGSSSMASVCGSTLSLMDAGVKIKSPISGIAMGLLMDEDSGDYHILTDIQAYEDFDGDMDFKVAGNREGITALQLDIKVKGLKLELLAEAMEKALIGRTHILDEMDKSIAAPREQMNQFAPRIQSFHIKEDFIAAVIGKGGETIQSLCKDFDVTIDIKDSGLVSITSTNQENGKMAKAAIDAITYEPEIGDVFENCTVKSIKDFGAFVEFAPKKEALLHISEIANERVEKVEDFLKLGQKITVKLTEIDKMGRIKLSMKQV